LEIDAISMSARRSSSYDAPLIAASAASSTTEVISGMITTDERRVRKGLRGYSLQ
jgi:hypothetical protein